MLNEANPYHIAPENRIGRWVIRAIGCILYRAFAKIRIFGLENVPARGGYIIAFNHISIFEPPFIMTHWPVAPEAIGAVEVWQEPEKKYLARMYGGIPIDRDQVSREPLLKAVQVLRSGYPLMMSPEGRLTWQPGLRRAKWGVAYLADKARVPVIPVGITGSTGDFLKQVLDLKRPTLETRIGKLISLPPLESISSNRRDALQHNGDLVMKQIAALLPEEYRGVYSEQTEILQGV
ncbi:MAG TPA: lysophospholipid acyltransferase family protein [Longilinea sp.]|nr:lysophospholipid acyltransferase family protein [Longilinea sp.]